MKKKKIQISDSAKHRLPVYFYLTTLFFSLLLILCGFLYAKTNVYAPSPETREISGTISQIDENTREVILRPDAEYGNCLMFYCNHSYIHVYSGELLLYSLEDGETIFGSTPGGNYHFIDLNNVPGDIVLNIEAVYPQSRNYELTFYQGDYGTIYSSILKSSVPRLIITLFSMFFCLTLIVLFITGRKKFQFENSSIWFCIFSLLVSMWALNTNPWMTLMCSNRVAACFMEYVLLMIMAPSAVLYIRDIFEPEGSKSRISSFLIFVSCINTLVLTGLHLTGIYEFKETVTITHVIMIIVLLYSFIVLFRCVKRSGLTRKTGVGVVCLVLLAFFYALDLTVFYLGRMTDIFGWLGISFCVIITGCNTLIDMFETVKTMQRYNVYKEMAVKDMDTGLYNRNAYNTWLENTPLTEGLYIITYDLNELKRCNDELGHLAGDKYIRDAAGIFRDVFGEYGTTYRLGGDEFLTILYDQTEAWILERLRNLEEKTTAYNETSDLIQMRIAYGYARYEKTIDKDYEATRHRADEKMYQNKIEMKRAAGCPAPR